MDRGEFVRAGNWMVALPSLISISLLSSIHAPIPLCLALPIPAPNITNCYPPSHLPEGETLFDCCAPPWFKPPITFQPHHSTLSRLRIRRPAHAVDREYAQKLNRAYQLMKALPPEDPRSFKQQANIHCAYCNAVYRHGNTSTPFQVHASWLFFPFHRWYLYFHERILASLLQDDTFALTFWNYDEEIGSAMPWLFLEYPHLNDSLRDASHLPPVVAQMDISIPSNRSRQEQLVLNARIMHHVMVSAARTPSLFFGMPYRFGDDPKPGYGTAEWFPHNMVHLWVGDHAQVGIKDMGSLYAAARDPMFYAHHANLDRFWEVWKSMEGHLEFQDPDFLDSEFVFYNENAELVKVKVRDSLSVENLGYTYRSAENTWQKACPMPITTTVTDAGPDLINVSFCKLAGNELLQEPCLLVVERKAEKEQQISMQHGSDLEEILVIEGIVVKRMDQETDYPTTGFHVFFNLPHADASTTLNCTEYAGTFWFLPQVMDGSSSSNPASLRLGIGFIVEELGLGTKDKLLFTIVPIGADSVFFSSIRLEYESIHGISLLAAA